MSVIFKFDCLPPTLLTLDEDINLANALDLSESEEEEELDTIIDDFGKLNDVRVIDPC